MISSAQLTIAILTALTPTVAVFLGVLIQRQESRDLRAGMTALRKDLQGDKMAHRKDLRGEQLSFRSQVHAGLLMIHELVARVEARQAQ